MQVNQEAHGNDTTKNNEKWVRINCIKSSGKIIIFTHLMKTTLADILVGVTFDPFEINARKVMAKDCTKPNWSLSWALGPILVRTKC